MNYVGLP